MHGYGILGFEASTKLAQAVTPEVVNYVPPGAKQVGASRNVPAVQQRGSLAAPAAGKAPWYKSRLAKGLGLAGGVGLGALGLYQLLKSKKPEEQTQYPMS